jgi:hypothetical protein
MAIRRQNKNSKPAAKKPAAKKPAAKKPAAKKPVSKKPAAKKPVSKKPAAKKPVAKKTVSKKPAAKKTVSKKPVAKKIVIDNAPPKIRVKRKMYEYEKIATNAKGNLFHLMGQRVQRGEVKWAYYTIEEGDMGYHYYIKLK